MLPCTFTVTDKGNGVLKVGGLALRIYDVYDDGVIYAGGLASIHLVDLDRDGVKEILISITVIYTDEKSAAATHVAPYVFVYKYDDEKGLLIQANPNNERFHIEVSVGVPDPVDGSPSC